MKYAFVNNEKTEASKGLIGICQGCGSELITKCGEIRINYWSHKKSSNCDHWWENETEWHRSWKNEFPTDWQEVVHFDDQGEKHIADVKTSEKWVVEFQHSFLKPEERRARNSFYNKIVWVVDGRRRPTDATQFQKAIQNGLVINYSGVPIVRINSSEDSRLLKEWKSSIVPVFFDFQESNDLKTSRLWFYIPTSFDSYVYVFPFSGSDFLTLHNTNGFDEMANVLLPGIRNFLQKHNASISRIGFPQIKQRRPRRRF